MSPFSGYSDFDECVQDNQDKESPEGYCAWLHYHITGKWPGKEITKKGGFKDMEIKKTDSIENKLERIRTAVYNAFDNAAVNGENSESPSNVGIVATFESAVIVVDYNTNILYEVDYSEVGEAKEIVFGTPREVEDVYVVKQMLRANPEIAYKDVQSLIDTWDDWAGSFDSCVSALEGTPGVDNPEALCAWLHHEAEGVWPGEKSRNAVELSGPIISVSKDKKKRIAYAAVLVPGEKDYDDETVTKEKVEDACHEWMDLYQNVDYKHTLNNVGKPIENYLTYSERVVKTLDGDELILPEGTWIIGSKLDEETFDAVVAGKLKGYSIMGIKRAALKALKEKDIKRALKSLDDKDELNKALKKTLLKDLGPDWVPVSVAVTDSPAVPKSKWFALKSKEQKTKSAWDRIKGILKLKSAEKRSGKINITKGGKEAMEITKEELKAMISGAVKEELKPIVADVEALKTEKSQAGKEEEKADEKKVEGEEEKKEAGKEDSKKDEKPEEKKGELDALKNDVAELKKGMEKVSKALGVDSKAIKGQDGDEEEKKPAVKDFGSRDSFGRKITKSK